MADRKSRQGEEDVLGQIFDFIFTEAKKPPAKRKPIKTTGISSSKALADGLAVALEAPGLIITDQILESMNNALTVEFGSLDAGNGVKAKITTTSLVDFLSDPGEFLSKAQKKSKAARDAMRAEFLGKEMQGLIVNAWARKYNLDLDARKAILGHYKAESIGKESEAILAFGSAAAGIAMYKGQILEEDKGKKKDRKIEKKAMMDEDKQYIVNRSADLIGREIFGRRGWEDMAPERKKEFQRSLLGGEEGLEAYMNRTYVGTSEKWKDVALKRYEDLISSEIGLEGKGSDLFDLGAYNSLEKRNIEGRIKDLEIYLRAHPNLSPVERKNIEIGISKLQQASVVVGGGIWDLDNISKTKIEIRKRIKDTKDLMLQAQKDGDLETVRRLKREIRDWKSSERVLNVATLTGRIGQAEGVINSWKSVMGGAYGENAVLSILNGDFFDSRRNQTFNPVKQIEVGIGSHKGKNEKGEVVDVSEIVKINVAAYESGLKGIYSKIMTPIYYLTPKSLMNSLFVNGEGFMYLYTSSIQREMKKKGIAKIDWKNLWNEEYLKSIGIDPKNSQVRRSLAKLFSLGQRQRDRLNAWFNEHISKKIREVVYKRLISRITDTAAIALMEQWLLKGGVKVIAKALAVTIINAIGMVATGGLGAFLVPRLTNVLVDVLFSAAKIIIQVVLLVSLGVVGFIIFGFSNFKESFDSKSFAYTNVVPGEVYTNPNFTGSGIYPISGVELPEGNHPFSGGSLPDGVQCLIGSNQYRCSQGAFGSYSHANISAIDIPNVDTFYAPSFCGEGNCVVTAVQDVNCYYGGSSYYAGGMVIFTANYNSTTYTFKLIHVYKNVSVGQKLSAGEAVVDIITGADHDKIKNCSTGSHLHLETKVNGSTVDPMEVMTTSTSSGGFGCSISACPVP